MSSYTQYGYEVAGTLTRRFDSSPCIDRGGELRCYVIQGDIARGAHFGQNGCGWNDEEVSYTLNTIDIPAVVVVHG